MNYRELLELYKTGQLDEETRLRVEKDIQRQDAISDYLFDSQELPPCDSAPEPEGDSSNQMLSVIQKSIHRAFVKMGVTVGAIVLAVVCLCAFVLPWFVSLFYYNPNGVMGRNPENPNLITTRMALDLSVFSEMFLPGAARQEVIARPEGWGNYLITIPQTASFDGHFRTAEGYLSRGKLTLYNSDVLRPPTGNAFLLPSGVHGGFPLLDGDTNQPIGPAGSPEEALAQLEKLEPDRWVTAYVSLSQVTEYADFYRWYEALDPYSAGTWCAVYTENQEHEMLAANMGFSIRYTASSQSWDTERYPYLCILGNEQSYDPESPEQAQTHFTSMLRYLQDHPEIVSMMPGNLSAEPALLEQMIASVERDGLKIYGFAIQTKQETLLQLAKEPNVSYIYTVPVN